MTVRSSLYTAKFIYTLPSTTLTLDQVDGVDPSTNATEAEIIPGGAVDRAHVGIGSASPTVGLRTRDLVTFFGTVSATAGLAVAGASTFYFQRRDDGGTFKTGSSNDVEM